MFPTPDWGGSYTGCYSNQNTSNCTLENWCILQNANYTAIRLFFRNGHLLQSLLARTLPMSRTPTPSFPFLEPGLSPHQDLQPLAPSSITALLPSPGWSHNQQPPRTPPPPYPEIPCAWTLAPLPAYNVPRPYIHPTHCLCLPFLGYK